MKIFLICSVIFRLIAASTENNTCAVGNKNEQRFLMNFVSETKRLKIELSDSIEQFLNYSIDILSGMREDEELNETSDALEAAIQTVLIVQSGGPISNEDQTTPARRKRQIISLVQKCSVDDAAIQSYNKQIANCNVFINKTKSQIGAVEKRLKNLNITWTAALAKNARLPSEVVGSIQKLNKTLTSLHNSLDSTVEFRDGSAILLAQRNNIKADCLNPFDANYLAHIPKACKRIYDFFDSRGVYLKSACLIEQPLVQTEAIVNCGKLGLNIFIVNNVDTMNALVQSATKVYAKTPNIKLWLNGDYLGPFYGWSVTDRSGHPMFTGLKWYKGIDYGTFTDPKRTDGLALVKFSLQEEFWYAPTDFREAHFYYCEIINPKF